MRLLYCVRPPKQRLIRQNDGLSDNSHILSYAHKIERDDDILWTRRQIVVLISVITMLAILFMMFSLDILHWVR